MTDLVGAGPVSRCPDGSPRASGVVIGFMKTISQALCFVDPAEVTLIEAERRREVAWVREQIAKQSDLKLGEGLK